MKNDIKERTETARRVLRACWTIVAAGHRDAVANDVEKMGKALGEALEAGDFGRCEEVLAEVNSLNSWMHLAGVIMGQREHVFDVRG